MHSPCGAAALFLLLLLAAATTALAEDPLNGKLLFERRCGGCHSLDQHKEGPKLRDVYGRAAGAEPSFGFSDALKNTRILWTSDTLDQWLTDPEKLVPGNDMAFRVLNAGERSAIIAYLKKLAAK